MTTRNIFGLRTLIYVFLLTFSFFTLAQKTVAVTTFYMNKKVQAGDLGLGASALKAAADLADDPSFRLDPMLDELHDTFFNDLTKEFPFTVMDESAVTGSQAYKDYELQFDEEKGFNKLALSYYIVYDGYKFLREGGKLTSKEKRDELNMLKVFPDADGIMFVSMWFAFEKKMAIAGTGSAGLRCYLYMQLFDKEGKKVFRYQEFAISKESVGIVGGVPVMKLEKILPMCQSSFDRMLGKMKKDIPKLTKKVDKKL